MRTRAACRETPRRVFQREKVQAMIIGDLQRKPVPGTAIPSPNRDKLVK
jgi:hypothetical protein